MFTSIHSTSRSFGGENADVDNDPVSTTNALMVMILAPRRVFTEKHQQAEEDDDVTAASTAVIDASEGTIPSKKKEEKADDDVEKKDPQNDMEGDTKACSAGDREDNSNDSTKTNEGSTDSNNDELKESTCNDDEDDEPSPEESAAVTEVSEPKHDCLFDEVETSSPEKQEVNVEELILISLKLLLDECHLFTAPSFSEIGQYRPIIKDGINSNVYSWLQVQFMVRPTSIAVVLERLERIGVGTNVGTVTVYKTELCRTTSRYARQSIPEAIPEEAPEEAPDEVNEEGKDDTPNNVAATMTPSINGVPLKNATDSNVNTEIAAVNSSVINQEALNKRKIEEGRMEWKNAATRLRIEQLREEISKQAACSFDFLALLAISSILAGIGLITNNTVVIVASMLVSPIMGPVLGLTFGTRIYDWSLVRLSFFSESLALLGCVLIGALVGLCSAFTNMARDDWPTNEMQIRGEVDGLIIGIAIAIPSGMGVALSVLDGNTSSLVGVAISASLLPPAVNAGVCFMYALLLQVNAVENDKKNGYDFAVIGATSFALTALNILCVWVAGLVMFEIKEVRPAKQKSAFWAKGLKIAREMDMGSASKPPPVDDFEGFNGGLRFAFHRETSRYMRDHPTD